MILEAVFKEEAELKADFGSGFPIGGKADYSIVANALKGKVSGEAVSMTDVSPLEHSIGVKLARKNLLDTTSLIGKSVTANGGTLTCGADGGISGSGTCTGYVGFEDIRIDLPVGVYTLSASGVFNQICCSVSLRDSKGTYLLDTDTANSGGKKTFNIADYPSYSYAVLQFKRNNNVELSGTAYFQLEEGTTATAYAPYVADVSSVTLTKCGKNLWDCEGYSAKDSKGIISNNQGTTLSTTEPVNGLTITQTTYTKPTDLGHYENGWFTLFLKEHLEVERRYTFSCDVEVLNNPLSSDKLGGLLQGNVVSILLQNNSVFEVGKKYRLSAPFTYKLANGYPERKCIEFRNRGMSLVMSNIQIEFGETATEYEPRIEPIPYTPNADGTVDGVTSLYPTTTLLTDTAGVTITAEYNKDTNKVIESLVNAIISLGGNV